MNYTTVEQSQKLLKLGLNSKSADMWWSRCTITDFGDGVLKVSYAVEPCNISQFRNTKEDIPCWSLVALLDILPSATLDSSNRHYYRLRCMERCTKWYNNPVDACYEMILRLHELNLL